MLYTCNYRIYRVKTLSSDPLPLTGIIYEVLMCKVQPSVAEAAAPILDPLRYSIAIAVEQKS